LTPAPSAEGQWLNQRAETALRATVPHVMPSAALACYARWWQYETWLREIIYVELRAQLGAEWVDIVDSRRQGKDATSLRHMPTADGENPLAYLDTTPLLDLLDYDWSLFELSLIDHDAWNGRRSELLKIRHRIMHLRRPHPDDLGRIEQTLRDLEGGAKVAIGSYNRRTRPNTASHSDPVTSGWLKFQHDKAHLIQHGDKVYGAHVEIDISKRPWLDSWPADLNRAAGVFWHLSVIFRNRTVDPGVLWTELSDRNFREVLVHLIFHDAFHVEFTFAAADSGATVANAIGYALSIALRCSSHVRSVDELDYEHFRSAAKDLDYRVLSNSAWGLVTSDYPGTIFSA
jgi:hypothetical protein